ncbi:MAG: S8 family serine peptidase [Acidimicrobiales bacterium]|jgi:subtilisin family serine protease|nr:S8 family serine peptidase [Acidimicrobiales bacterium]
MRDAQNLQPAATRGPSTFAAVVIAFVIAIVVAGMSVVLVAGAVSVRQAAEDAKGRAVPAPVPDESGSVGDGPSAEPAALNKTQDTAGRIGAGTAHDEGITGEGWAVVVIDTGVEADHPYFEDRVVEEACFTHFGQCPNGEDSMVGQGAAAPCESPDCDHGTHVAGIAVGDDGPGGRSGVAPGADLIAIRVFTDERIDVCGSTWCPSAYDDDVLDALEYVREELVDEYQIAAVNLSLGYGEYQDSCDRAESGYTEQIEALAELGIPTVVASGNESLEDAVGSPACVTSAVAVGSVTQRDVVATWSNTSPQLDLVAPGDNVASASGEDDYVVYSGTSMAAPHVSGAWALLRSAGVDGDVDELLELLQSTGVEANDPRNGATTCRIDVAVALELEEDPDGEPCEPRFDQGRDVEEDEDVVIGRPGRPEIPGLGEDWN